MKKIQSAKANVINLVINFVDNPDTAALIMTYLIMKNDVVHLKLRKTEMEVHITIALTDFTAITASQKTARKNMAEFIYDKINAPSLRYFRGIDDAENYAVFDTTKSKFKKITLSKVIEKTDSFIDKAEEFLESTPAYVTATGMTSDIISDARDYRDALNGFLGKAKVMKNKVSDSLAKITKIQKEIWEFDFVNLMDDAQHFNATHPELAIGLAKAMKIDDLPTQHTAIFGTITDEAGNPVIGATVVNLDMPQRAPMVTNNLGEYRDEIFKWGIYRYKYTHPTKVEQIHTISIKRGKKVMKDVVMVAKP